jgi:hypothetical protein
LESGRFSPQFAIKCEIRNTISRRKEKGSPKRIGPFAVPKAMSSTASATLATWFKIHGVNYSISSACSTSAHCIGNAYEIIQLGKQDIIFAAKVFYDSAKTKGDGFVYIGGTLTGEGIANKNNTVMIACYNDSKECLFSSVDQIGPNQVGRLGAPDRYAITTWTPDEIVATGYYASDCRKITINLDRKAESVVWVEEPINPPRAACFRFARSPRDCSGGL